MLWGAERSDTVRKEFYRRQYLGLALRDGKIEISRVRDRRPCM